MLYVSNQLSYSGNCKNEAGENECKSCCKKARRACKKRIKNIKRIKKIKNTQKRREMKQKEGEICATAYDFCSDEACNPADRK